MSQRKTGIVAGGCGLLLALSGISVLITLLAGSGGSRSESTSPAPAEALPTRSEVKTEPTNAAPAAPKRELAAAAFYVGQQACEKALKAPASAKFSNPFRDEDTGWSAYGFNQWKVFGHVDSQNSFGAMLRSQWLAVIRLSGETYELLYLRVGDEESGPMPAVAAAPGRQLSREDLAAVAQTNESRKAAAVATALKYNQDLAAKGDAYGQYRMGQRYLIGDGVEKDLAKAREMFQKAAAQGHSGAAEELAKLEAR